MPSCTVASGTSHGRLMESEVDYLPALSLKEKREFLQSVSYQDYLLETVGVHPDAMPFLDRTSYWAIGIDALSAWAAVESGYPGLTALGFGDDDYEPRYFSFPDGNSSIARLLVRSLNPRVASGGAAGEGMEEIVTARFDYSRLDHADTPVRIRLNSTAIHVGHVGEAESASEVEVAYVRDGRTERARAGHCVLACYHSMIPHLCPELPKHQRVALGQSLKAPLVYTNVLLRDWTAFERLGVRRVSCPGSYHASMRLSRPMTLGGYRSSETPEDPTVLFMSRTPQTPGLSAQGQWRAGRLDLLTTPFETFERNIRDQLGRALADGGFDPARDIEAITVNRWPHGYSYGQDPETGQVSFVMDELPRERRPWLRARKTWGRIAIANGDGYPIAMTEAAIGQAHRAVGDLL